MTKTIRSLTLQHCEGGKSAVLRKPSLPFSNRQSFEKKIEKTSLVELILRLKYVVYLWPRRGFLKISLFPQTLPTWLPSAVTFLKGTLVLIRQGVFRRKCLFIRRVKNMAALRVVVFSGTGRALLNTSKSFHTPRVWIHVLFIHFCSLFNLFDVCWMDVYAFFHWNIPASYKSGPCRARSQLQCLRAVVS